MGMLTRDRKLRMNIRTYYISDILQEDAGNGNVRIWNCSRKSGILVPECEIIIAATNLLIAGRMVSEFAQNVFNSEQLRMMGEKVH